MDANRAANELKALRDLMERPVRYSTMSGLSGVLAGLASLGGVFADLYVSGRYADRPAEAVRINMGIWAGVFLAAFAAATIPTRLRERKRGMPFWSRIKKQILLTILPPFVGGVGLTAAVVYRWWIGDGPNLWGLIPAIWMLFYGLALWQVGLFSPAEIRVLAVAFLLAGLVTAALFHTYPYWAMGLTFGGFHIVYGVVVWARHGG